MSQSSQMPPGNRPSSPRVFRPFVGAPAGQGSQSPSPPPAQSMGRRPGRPYRPFAGQPVEGAPAQPAESLIAATSVADTAPTVMPEVVAAPPTYEPTQREHDAWETFVEAAPALADLDAESIADETPVKYEQPVTAELPQIEERDPTPAFGELAFAEPESELPVTAEVPVYSDEREEVASVSEEVASVSEEVASVSYDEAEPVAEVESNDAADALDLPMFVAPTSEPPADSVIDEVDAAFITAGLPTNGESPASGAALSAAALLESIARRLRNGDLELRAVTEANTSSEESALATVLAALLANR